MARKGPINGIDYLVDYYSILGIEKNASQKEIKKSYREQIKQYHPDLVSRAAPEIQKQTKLKSESIITAYQILSDSKNKKVYDEQLTNFDGPISKDGIPIIDLSKKSIEIDSLISGDTEKDKDKELKQAKKMAGFNENIFKIIKQQYEQNPTEDVKKAYKEMLINKSIYLSLLETVEWNSAGVTNQKDTSNFFYPEDHISKIKEQIEDVKQTIKRTVEKRVLALGTGLAPKLLVSGKEYESKDVKENELALKKELTDLTINNFKSKIQGISKLAEERAKVLEELLKFTEWEYWPKKQEHQNNLLIILSHKTKIQFEILYAYKDNNVATSPQTNFKDAKIEDFKKNKAKLDEILESGTNIAILYRNIELDVLLESGYIMDKHFDS